MSSLTSAIASIEIAFSKILVFADVDTSIARPKLPVELFDHVIDELHDDSVALRTMSLVCTRAMIRSRRWLFSTLSFDKDDNRFDAFLDLLERSRWTTFSAVKCIRITDLFRPRWHFYRIGRDVNRMVTHLPNLKSIWLSSTQVWQISWPSIPAHVRNLITNLDLHDLQIDSILFHPKDWTELFCRVGKAVTMTLYNLEFGMMDDLAHLSARSLNFKSVDTSSILPLEPIWNWSIANGLQITVDTFHLRPLQLPPWNRNYCLSFLSQKFLRHVGPSIRCLFFNLSGAYFSLDALRCYDSLDLSRCVNLRAVRFGCFSLEETSSRMAMMWTLLETLPSPTGIEEISITVGPKDEFKESRLGDFEAFPWAELVERLKRNLPKVKAIEIGVGTYKNPWASLAYVEKLRNIEGLKEHVERGLVTINRVYWGAQSWVRRHWISEDAPCLKARDVQDELPWRQVMGNN